MLVLAPLLLSSDRLGGIKTWFLRFITETGSDRREVFGGFCYVPRDLSNGTWIIAIGLHSRKLGRRVGYVCLFVCLLR